MKTSANNESEPRYNVDLKILDNPKIKDDTKEEDNL